MKKGFTLIELLVVVLIIGILAAVALPQYQKTVDKSRAAEIWPLLQSYKQAVDAFMLSAGTDFVGDTSLLDIELPEVDCEFSFARHDCEFMHSGEDDQGRRGVIWGSFEDNFGLGITPDGRRFCVGEAEYCKVLGFTVDNGNTYSWGTEYMEN